MNGAQSRLEWGVQWKQDPPMVFETREAAHAYRDALVAEAVSLGLVDHGQHMRVVSRTVFHHESAWQVQS